MGINKLTIDTIFIVNESKWLNVIISFFFFILFFVSMQTDENEIRKHNKAFKLSLAITIIPAVIFFKKAFINDSVIKIDKTGFYYKNKFITDWKHFKGATLKQKEVPGSIKDNFIVLLEYYKQDLSGYFIKEISLTNTQNKSEEEIMDAIKYFSEKFT